MSSRHITAWAPMTLTLQVLRFYSNSWTLVGTPDELSDQVSAVTGVKEEVLRKQRPVLSSSIGQRMCWASNRVTTRIEDRAYSLLGIFNVNMGVIYGEGEKAFQRLQDELLRTPSDQTIFAWTALANETGSQDASTGYSNLLASSPAAFRGCGNLELLKSSDAGLDYYATSTDITFDLPLFEPKEKGPGFSTQQTR